MKRFGDNYLSFFIKLYFTNRIFHGILYLTVFIKRNFDIEVIRMNVKKTLSALLASLLIGASAAVTVSALEPHGTGILCRNWLTNDPNYTFSEAYMESVWYENFSTLELGSNQRNNILSIAISQLGYHEGDVGDYSGKGTSSGNCIEYARLLIPNCSNNAYEWCACFVNWCLNQAHIDYASSEIGCWKWVVELKAMNMFKDSVAYGGTYTPKPADMIFFNWKNTNTNSGHIGYVLYTTEDRVYTIEGNADNNVTVRSYALNDPCVIGYGTPPYDEGDVPTVDHSYKDGMPRGEYVVNATGLSLMKAPDSTSRVTRVSLGSRVTLIGEDGDYAHVYYGDKEGYIKKDNLYLMAELKGEDILTYDANSGEGAPEEQTVPFGIPATVTDAVPTLEGDTFLGWSLVPYNYKVDYKAGDSITLQGNTTLYAVWEKRSFTLATEALADGKAAEFERPESIENTGALQMGSSDVTEFIDTATGDTKIDIVDDADAWGGKALSLQSTQKSNDPFVILDYAALCEKLQYAPTSADTVDYIILRVKDVSLYNVSLEVFARHADETEVSASGLLSSSEDWQYLVLDMTGLDLFKGELQKLRIDWTKAANEAGNTLLIDGIYFAANEAQRDAILAGKYIYPAQPIVLPPETETETETETEPETLPESETLPETDTEAESESEFESDTTSAESGAVIESGTDAVEAEGCTSLVGAAGLILLSTLGGAWMLSKRKHN